MSIVRRFTIAVLIVGICLPFLSAYIPDGYIGCYKDCDDRVLNGSMHEYNNNTGDQCIRVCREQKFKYAGTQYASQCFCGHQLTRNVTGDGCTTPCNGNDNETCGGTWHISIYSTWQKEPYIFTTTLPSSVKSNVTSQPELTEGSSYVLPIIPIIVCAFLAVFVALAICVTVYFLRRRLERRKCISHAEINQGPYSIPTTRSYSSEGDTNIEIKTENMGLKRNAPKSHHIEDKPTIESTDRKGLVDSMHYYANTAEYVNGMLDYPEQVGKKSSYDHMTVQSTNNIAIDKTYSKLWNAKYSNHPSYSHVDIFKEQRREKEEHGGNDGDVYNNLNHSVKAQSKSETDTTCTEASDYDHANVKSSMKTSHIADNYSHLHSVPSQSQNHCNVFNENMLCKIRESINSTNEYDYALLVN